ncbi:MAG TPA: hypothetical protein VJQ79_12020 [Acidimicrobiia bacterium]|nr:hypothetical protein [Acidimicrobiia bacterium]
MTTDKIPDVGPLVEDLLKLATNSLQRTSDQAMDVWKEVTSGDYEPKFLLRDTALFWARATKDIASTIVLVRDFLGNMADADKAAEST